MKKPLLSTLLLALLVLAGVWGFWQWNFCRFYVEPGHIAVITAKNGKPLPPGRILAEPGQRGVQAAVLPEGRHFLNPVFYDHTIERAIEIPPGKVGVVTAKDGTELPPGEFLAEPGQKGIWRSVLGPGRYRMNPVGFKVDIIDALSIPVGYVGVVTSLSGKQAAEGAFAGQGEKGVRADILQPGLYYINPRAFKIDVLEIGINQVTLIGKDGGAVVTKGQITSNSAVMELQSNALLTQQEKRQEYVQQSANFANSAPQSQAAPAPAGKVATGKSYSGRLGNSTPETLKRDNTGTLSITGGALSLDVAEAKMKRNKAWGDSIHYGVPVAEGQMAKDSLAAPGEPPTSSSPRSEAALVLNQFVEFPSKDGFEISLDMTVEFELLPQNIASIFRNYGDLPAAVDKVILPQILSISRLRGSAYGAKDFIVGEGREKFQTDMTEALAKVLGEKKIVINNALIRHVNVPMQILDPIQQASIAQEQDLTNQEKQNTAKKQAELNTQISLIDQARQQVGQETEKLKANILAEQRKEVAEIGGETLKQVAQIQKETAAVRALKTTTLGEAETQVIAMVEGEKAIGYQMKIKAFGDPVAYNLWTFANALNDEVKINILHSGAGTLWTDLQKATLGELGGAAVLKGKK
jgi:hypothetical protein